MVCEMAEYRRLIRSLKIQRHRLKLTQVAVSSRMRVEVNLVNRWENFRRFPKGPMLIRWARALGLNLEIGPDPGEELAVPATPAMIEAGVGELLSYSDEDLQYTDSALVVRMMRARGQPDPVPIYPQVSVGESVGCVEALNPMARTLKKLEGRHG